MKKISEFLSENFQFLVVNFSIYLNRHVFVMFSKTGVCRCLHYWAKFWNYIDFKFIISGLFWLLSLFRNFRIFMRVTDEALLAET